jgi:hypothetical protein
MGLVNLYVIKYNDYIIKMDKRLGFKPPLFLRKPFHWLKATENER